MDQNQLKERHGINAFLKSVDFKSVAGHPCLLLMILLSVVKWIHLDKLMNEKIALTDGGNLDYYLGVKFEYPDDMNLVVHQRGYAEKLLKNLV